jgi:L-iditol 2-dehydrogenase
MHAALFHGPNSLIIENFDPGRLKPDELMIKIGACGVCGTDFHIYNGEAPAEIPVVIGHEFTGEVIETGSGINNFNLGDRVAVDPNIPCNICEFCRSGRINLCKNLKALGVTINGGFSYITRVPVSQAYLLPPNFPYEIAAFAEPLSCCIHGINQAEIKLSDNVAIIGAGTIGLLMLQLVKLKNPRQVYVFEKVNYKKEVAFSLGADKVIDPSDSPLEETADIVIECAGTQESAELSLIIIKEGGKIVLFGKAAPSEFLSLNLQSFFHKELTIKASLLNPYTFQTAVDLLVTGKIKVDSFKIEKINLSQPMINKLFQQPKDGSVVKYMLEPNLDH